MGSKGSSSVIWVEEIAGIKLSMHHCVSQAPAGKPTEQEYALECKPQLPQPYLVQHLLQ